MIEIGKFNKLKILKIDNKEIVLDGKNHGEIFLFAREISQKCNVGDELEVFIYLNSKDKIIATMKKPFGAVGEFAYLKVISVNTVGAFLDWGLGKDLLVPFREQEKPMKEGRSYVVYIYFDEKSKRIAASSKYVKFINDEPADYKEGQQVNLLIVNESNLGFKAIINKTHWGVLYKNEVFKPLQKGDEIMGFIKKIRSDGKIDLSLHEVGHKEADVLTKIIINTLKNKGGFIPVNDKSSPEEIYKLFGKSKSNFKNAIGILYKKRLITIEKNGIRLCDENSKK